MSDKGSRAHYLVSLLSMKLHEHLEAIEKIIDLWRSSPPTGALPVELVDALSRLRQLRASISRDAAYILEEIGRGVGGEEAEDLYALAGYYVDAAYYTELSLLEKLGSGVVPEKDLVEIRLLRERMRAILDVLSKTPR